ncbi:MAG: GNAT family N-acetyltransferase, partial [Anaerolineae bacterium]
MQIVTLDSSQLSNLHVIIQRTAYERRLDLTELRHRIWEDPSVVPELLLGALEDGVLAGFCLGCIREGRGVITLFGVQPEYRRKGIATALFNEEETRLRARGV